jgi:DNA-binding LacI/PurR family transcriptional regulator
MASIRAISKATSFSVATVSEALRDSDKVRDETKKLIRDTAERMGYQRNVLVGDVMSSMRRAQVANFRGTLAVLETTSFSKARSQSQWHIHLFEAARNRAAELGYKMEFFEIKTDKTALHRMEQILLSRGIQGIVLPPFSNKWDLEGLHWERFSAVQLDYGLKNMRMHTIMPDHHTSLLNALTRLVSRGYRRPGLLVERFQDARIMLKWMAAYKAFEGTLNSPETLPVFEPHSLDRSTFFEWFYATKPDVVVAHRGDIIDWLQEASLHVPNDIGFFSLNIHHTNRDTAGLNLLPDQLGVSAIESLVGRIYLNQTGAPATPQTTLLEAKWVDGWTIKPALETSGIAKNT